MTKCEQVLAWFINNIGQLTYSQLGSRNGSDGTADCSGSMSQALNNAYGGATLYSTISIHERLTELGYVKIWSGKTTDARPNLYDVVMTTSSSNMAGSGGDSGHIGMMMTNEKYISCTAVDWLGKGNFIKNNAIQTCPWLQYKDRTRLQNYCEIWWLVEAKQVAIQPIRKGDTKMIFAYSADGQTGTFLFDGVNTLAFAGNKAKQAYDHYVGTFKKIMGKDIPNQHKTKEEYALWVQLYPVKYVNFK